LRKAVASLWIVSLSLVIINSKENLFDTIREGERGGGISALGARMTVPPLQLRLVQELCQRDTEHKHCHPAQLRCLSGLHNKVKRTSDYAFINLII
jgi:hypothetical protein